MSTKNAEQNKAEELKDEQLDAVQGGAGIRTITGTKKGFTAIGDMVKKSGELTKGKKSIMAESGDGSI